VAIALASNAVRSRHRRLPAPLLSLLLVAIVAGPATAEPPRLALDSHPWPPYYLDDAARPGYVREILATCLPAIGYGTRYFPLELGETLSALRSGKLDVHVLAREPEREKYAVFGEALLFTDAYRPVVRAGSGAVIGRTSDLDGLRLGHVRGLRYTREFHDYVYGRVVAGTAVEGETNEELLRRLLANEIDVFVGPVATNRWLARRLGVEGRIDMAPWQVKESAYFLAVSRQSSRITEPEEFLAGFDGCVEAMRSDGRLGRLARDYGLDGYP
jgi:ABC-type amino acid transport substrate-binding protein